MSRVRKPCAPLLLLAYLAFCACGEQSSSGEPGSEFLLEGQLPLYPPFKSRNYAGYIDLPEGRQGFFWFVESQGNVSGDPLLLWLNGGPGCSSIYGTLQESGPYVMRGPPYEFRDNKFTFARVANVLYIESPGGVGFSTDTTPPILWDDNKTSLFNYEFLKGWFEKFPQFRYHDFFIAGESYAGHYVPQLADRILEGEDAQIRQQMKGFMVGDPCTGDFECSNHDPTLLEYLRTHGFAALNTSIGPSIPTAAYDPYDILKPTCPNVQMMEMIRWPHPVVDALRNKVKKHLQQHGSHQHDSSDGNIGGVDGMAHDIVFGGNGNGSGTPINPGAPHPWGPCEGPNVHNWMNRDDVKKALHAPMNITWHSCNPHLKYNMSDPTIPVTPLYEKFFEATNWSIMIYSGLDDSIINFIATQTIVAGFNRPLAKKEYTPWHYPYVYDSYFPVLGGFYLQYDRISWAGVRDSGHMVPMFNPPAALELLISFLTTGGPGRM